MNTAVGQDTAFSQAVQRLSAYADFGDGPHWPQLSRPAPRDVRILLNRYRDRREEIRFLKQERNGWKTMYFEQVNRTPDLLEDLVGRVTIVKVPSIQARARRRLHWVLRRVLK